jgi:hypothetical protein
MAMDPGRRDPFSLLVLDEAFVARAVVREPSAAERSARPTLVVPPVTLGAAYRTLVTALVVVVLVSIALDQLLG